MAASFTRLARRLRKDGLGPDSRRTLIIGGYFVPRRFLGLLAVVLLLLGFGVVYLMSGGSKTAATTPSLPTALPTAPLTTQTSVTTPAGTPSTTTAPVTPVTPSTPSTPSTTAVIPTTPPPTAPTTTTLKPVTAPTVLTPTTRKTPTMPTKTTPTKTTPTTTPPPSMAVVTIAATVRVKRCASCAATLLPPDSYVFFRPVTGGQAHTSYTLKEGRVGARLKPGTYRVLVAPPYFTSQRFIVDALYRVSATDTHPTFLAGPKTVS